MCSLRVTVGSLRKTINDRKHQPISTLLYKSIIVSPMIKNSIINKVKSKRQLAVQTLLLGVGFALLAPLLEATENASPSTRSASAPNTNVIDNDAPEQTVIQEKGRSKTPRPVMSAPSSRATRLVNELEAEQGPYSSSLGESLLSLGTQLQHENDHVTAIEVLDRAMHTQRINEGLYSLSQVKVIERLIESHIAMGDWQAATKRHQHIYWLHQRNFGQNDPRMLPVIEKLSFWHLNAFSLNTSAVVNHLLSAYHLFKVAVQIIDKNYGTDDLRLIRSLKGLALSNYYLATIDTNQNKLAPSSKNATLESESRARLEQYILNSYYNGKQAITRIMNVYQSNLLSETQKAIETKVQLGDWYMMFNRPYSAINVYKDAHSLIQSSESEGVSSDRQESMENLLFGAPKSLPDNQLYGSLNALTLQETKTPETHIQSEAHHYVVVQFDVTERGHARNIKIVDASEKIQTSHKVKAKQQLKNRLFRPRFAKGQPVDTKDLLHKFVFTPAI